MSATSTAAIEIRFLSSGAGTVGRDFDTVAGKLTDLQRRINANTGVGGSGGTGGLLSADGAAAQMSQRLNADLLRDRGLQLEKMRNGFKVAGDEGGRFAGRLGEISNHTAMLGGRLLGIDPLLLRLGGKFGVFGLAAAAGLSLLNKSLEAVRSNLEGLELKDNGKLDTLWRILSNTPFERDDAARRNRLGGESDARMAAFEKSNAAPDWLADWKEEVRRFEVDTGEKMGGDALRSSYELAKLRGEQAEAEVEAEKERIDKLNRYRKVTDAEYLAFKMAKDEEAAAKRAALEDDLRGARGRLRDRQMGDVERGAAPWRDLSGLNWFANIDAAGSQADRLAMFRATNSVALPDSVDAQLKELRQREVEELGALTAAIQSLEARIRTAGGDPNTIGEWSTTGAF